MNKKITKLSALVLAGLALSACNTDNNNGQADIKGRYEDAGYTLGSYTGIGSGISLNLSANDAVWSCPAGQSLPNGLDHSNVSLSATSSIIYTNNSTTDISGSAGGLDNPDQVISIFSGLNAGTNRTLNYNTAELRVICIPDTRLSDVTFTINP